MKNGIIKTLDIEYNLDYLVIVPIRDRDLLEGFVYTFKNVITFDGTTEDTDFFVKFLRKNVVKTLIFVDYYVEYNEMINTLIDEHQIKFIFTDSLGELSNPYIRNGFEQVCQLLEAGMIDEVGFLDENLFKTLNARRNNVRHVMLDIEPVEAEANNEKVRTIGVLNSSRSDYSSFYNELSALSFFPQYTARVRDMDEAVKVFTKAYGIRCVEEKSLSKLAQNNLCNLDINFAGFQTLRFLASMDAGVPCIIGNNDFLPKGVLERLVVRSDDDVDEMRDKIEEVANGVSEIFAEYKTFRAEYSQKARKSAEDFIGGSITDEGVNNDYEKMLSVIVPVYNTEKFLERCLDSILAARIPGMEVLIINDGSTDGSGEIARRYAEANPDLIRYIEKENGGLGSVRNVGLREARGKYLAAVDSDDTIEPRFIRDGLCWMKKDVDVIVCDWMSVGKRRFETAALDSVFSNERVLAGIIYTSIMPSACNKILKKSLFFRRNLKYMEGKYEDLSVIPAVMLAAESVKYLRKPYYNYYLTDCSLMRSAVKPSEMVDAIAYLDENLAGEENNFDVEKFNYYTFAWRIEEYVMNPLFSLSAKELSQNVEYIERKIADRVSDVFMNPYYRAMLEKLKNAELRDFIEARNEAFGRGRLVEFVASHKNTEHKLTAGIIYYGD